MKTHLLLVFFFSASISSFAQDSLKIVEKILVEGSWYVTIRNGAGKFRDGTGDYVFKIFTTNDLTKSIKYRFAKTNPSSGTGEWRTKLRFNKQNQKVYVLTLSFDNEKNSPVNSNAALDFEINLLNPDKLDMVLSPPPTGHKDRITMNKH